MFEGKTKSGFKFSVDERAVKSWEFTEACTMMLSDDSTEQLRGSVQYVNAVLGKEKAKLIEHIKKKKDGFCETEDIVKEVAEIVQKVKELKN